MEWAPGHRTNLYPRILLYDSIAFDGGHSTVWYIICGQYQNTLGASISSGGISTLTLTSRFLIQSHSFDAGKIFAKNLLSQINVWGRNKADFVRIFVLMPRACWPMDMQRCAREHPYNCSVNMLIRGKTLLLSIMLTTDVPKFWVRYLGLSC